MEKIDAKRQFRRPRRRREYNIKLDFKEIRWGEVDMIQLAPEGTVGWLW